MTFGWCLPMMDLRHLLTKDCSLVEFALNCWSSGSPWLYMSLQPQYIHAIPHLYVLQGSIILADVTGMQSPPLHQILPRPVLSRLYSWFWLHHLSFGIADPKVGSFSLRLFQATLAWITFYSGYMWEHGDACRQKSPNLLADASGSIVYQLNVSFLSSTFPSQSFTQSRNARWHIGLQRSPSKSLCPGLVL